MTSPCEPTDDNKASRMMRKAILQELRCRPGEPDEPAVDMLQQVARSLVQKAGGASQGKGVAQEGAAQEGATQKGAAQDALVQNLSKKLEASGSLKDAAALLRARRAVR